jgi:hypothetical protein
MEIDQKIKNRKILGLSLLNLNELGKKRLELVAKLDKISQLT